jgi:TrmH family RNA methyltransferase
VSGSVRPGAVKQVTSLANPTIKEIRALAMRKRRVETGLFVAEGLKLLIDALDAGWPVRTVLVAASTLAQEAIGRAAVRARAQGAEVLEVSESVMASVTRRDNPQTVVGVFEQRIGDLSAIDPRTSTVWIGLEAVRDPGNLGTIVRTADAAGASGIILIGDTTDPFGIDAVRATMGSLFHVGLARASLEAFLAWRPRFPGAVVGTHLAATEDLRKASFAEPAILLMGGEQAGLSDRLAAACDRLVKIPMAGRADSLNLAVSTGIALFEMRRDRLSL